MIEQNIQYSILNDIHVQFKSKAVVKVSTTRTPNFIRHKVNTNLNLKPHLFLSNEAESLGMRCSSGDFCGFSSFQMANMFLEYIGKVDIISNAENIKNLCKVPYSKKSVSIMVHRIDETLLLDEFDVEKYLTQDTFEKWAWLKKFFYNNIVKSSDTTKMECITLKKNNSRRIEHKNLVSKFLHHSIGLESHNDQIKNGCNEITTPLASPLLKPTPEEVFPDFPQVYRLFNRNMLWDFKDLQMLIGTDLPIFRNDNNSPLSAKLRDMSKPLSMLTGIDYWLENLMNDIPEIEFCYHINGIVQKYEQVKTKDIPCLNGSTFSPNIINDNIQKIISFLKSNTYNVGYTYWLFKGKNDDTLKLYDLTTLCSESLIDSPNPFTFPMTTLLCRVAYKLKHNQKDGKPDYNPLTILPLLNNSLKLLDKTKHPQVVITVNYMLSDIYLYLYNKSLSTVKKYLTCYAIVSYDFRNRTYSVDKQNESITYETVNISQISKCSTSTYNLKTLYKSFYKALYYIGNSLSCLQYFKIGNQNKNKKKNNRNKVLKKKYDIDSNSENIFYIIIAESKPRDLNYPPNTKDSDFCNYQLKQILYTKASYIYLKLGNQCCLKINYGMALKYFRRSFKCLLSVANDQFFNLIFKNCGDCFLFYVLHWDDIEQFISEFETDDMYDFELREMLLCNSKDFTNKDLNRIPSKIIKSKEDILKAAEYCYSRALVLETNTEEKMKLNKRISSVYNEYTVFYLNEIIMAVRTYTPVTLVKLKWLKKKSEHYFTLGSDIFKKQDNKANFIQMHRNLADVYKYIALCYSKFQIPLKEFIKEDNIYFKVIDIYTKLLSELDNRSSNPELWDTVYYDYSSILYYLSVQNYIALQRDSLKSQQKCIDSFKKALEYCDLENDTPNRFEYEFRSAYIHLHLAYLFSIYLEQCISTKSPKLDSVLLKIESYHTIAFETYFKIKCPLDCLEVLIQMIIIDMHFIDGTWHDIKYVKSIIKTLRKCNVVFQMLENKDSTIHFFSKNIILDLYYIDNEKNKFNLIKSLKENICTLLKCSMLKLAINKTSKWLADNELNLKTIYSNLLTNNIDGNNYSQLIIAINQLSILSND